MFPTIPSYYDTCEPFLLPSPPTDPEVSYVPKIIFSNNTTRMVLTPDFVRVVIQRSIMENPCNQRYQFLTQREVRLVKAQEPMSRIELFLNPDQVSDGEVKLILRNDGLNNFSVFSLLPRENRPMAEASSPKSTDGTQASTSAIASTSTMASASTMASTSGLALDQQRYPSLSRPITYPIHNTHTIKLPYECGTCGQGYLYKTALKSHQKIWHSGNHPYECKTCGNQFLDRSALERHEDKHLPTKNHKCHLCGKKYKYSTGLLGHLRTAHGYHNLNKS